MIHDHDVAVSKVAAPFTGTWVGTALAPYRNFLAGFAWEAIPSPARVAMLARCETSEAAAALAGVTTEISSSVAAPEIPAPEEGVNFRMRAAAYLLEAVAKEPLLVASLQTAMSTHANWLRVGSSITRLAVNDLSVEDVYEGLSDEIRTKITTSPGGIGGAWLSFSDLERTQVILSRPVMEANPAKLNESIVVAVQQALNAYVLAVPAVSAVIDTSPQVIISTGPVFATSIAEALEATPSPQAKDAAAWLMALGKSMEAKTPELRTTLAQDLRGYCYSMTSPESETSIRRFWAALRECYAADEIASAFIPHNIALNVVSGDIATTQNFLSTKMLGGLASAFMACEDLTSAWAAMPLHSYLELGMYPEFVAANPAFAEATTKVRRIFVKIIAKAKEPLLREILIAGTDDESAFTAIENLLVKPSLNAYRLADFSYPDPPPREFAHKLVHLANRVRVETEITPEWVKDFQTLMSSSFIAPEDVEALSRAGSVLFPAESALPVLEAAVSEYGKISGP